MPPIQDCRERWLDNGVGIGMYVYVTRKDLNVCQGALHLSFAPPNKSSLITVGKITLVLIASLLT